MRGPTSFVIVSKFGRTFSDSNLFEPVPGRGRYPSLPYKISTIDLGDAHDCRGK